MVTPVIEMRTSIVAVLLAAMSSVARADALDLLVGDWDVDATEVTGSGVQHRRLQELTVRAAADRVDITVREPGRDAPVWQNAFVLERAAGGPGLVLVEVWRSGARIRHDASFDGAAGRLSARGRLPDGTEVTWCFYRVGARLVFQRDDRKGGALVASSYEVLSPRRQ